MPYLQRRRWTQHVCSFESLVTTCVMVPDGKAECILQSDTDITTKNIQMLSNFIFLTVFACRTGHYCRIIIIIIIINSSSSSSSWGTRWCSWLRHCATSWRVAGSIPDVIIGIFH